MIKRLVGMNAIVAAACLVLSPIVSAQVRSWSYTFDPDKLGADVSASANLAAHHVHGKLRQCCRDSYDLRERW